MWRNILEATGPKNRIGNACENQNAQMEKKPDRCDISENLTPRFQIDLEPKVFFSITFTPNLSWTNQPKSWPIDQNPPT